jgi:hypothetical protein
VIGVKENGTTMAMKRLDLETVVRGLHSSDIRVGVQTFSGGITVWGSDRLHRVRADRAFDDGNPLTSEDSVARWMHSTVLQLFPESKYALGYRRRAPGHSGDATTAV